MCDTRQAILNNQEKYIDSLVYLSLEENDIEVNVYNEEDFKSFINLTYLECIENSEYGDNNEKFVLSYVKDRLKKYIEDYKEANCCARVNYENIANNDSSNANNGNLLKDKLNDKEKLFLDLIYLQGQSYEDIAKKFNVSVEMVKNKENKLICRLKECTVTRR